MNFCVNLVETEPNWLNVIKYLLPLANIGFLFYIAKVVNKYTNLEIKKRELMFSATKDFESKLDIFFNKITNIFDKNTLDGIIHRRILIELKVISNQFEILLKNIATEIDTNIVEESRNCFDTLNGTISDIGLFHSENTNSVEKEIINSYSEFLGSYTKLKFSLLIKKKIKQASTN